MFLVKNKITESINPPDIDFKTSKEYQEKFDQYIKKGVICVEDCSEKVTNLNAELNKLKLREN